MIRVAVIGARGFMGRFSCELLDQAEAFEVVARLEVEDDLEAAFAKTTPQLALDFTVAGQGFDHGRRCLEAGVRPVIGTSGVSLEQTDELDRLARRLDLGGLVIPNFSVGMWLAQRASVDCARLVPDWELEILELHHERKQDAPSGTAADTAERMARAAGLPLDKVPIVSVRQRGLYAHHEMRFGGTREILRIRHDMQGPEAFGSGILLALERATRITGVERGLGATLEERIAKKA